MTKQVLGFTVTPDNLFDVVMPQVNDTEWRLICIILRQTIGWRHEDGTCKDWDWLSHSQLRTRMNHSSATVSKTIDSLVTKGLIEVATSSGKLLTTALQRRNAHARMYFRLSRKVFEGSSRF